MLEPILAQGHALIVSSLIVANRAGLKARRWHEKGEGVFPSPCLLTYSINPLAMLTDGTS